MGVLPYKSSGPYERRGRAVGQKLTPCPAIFRRDFRNHHLHGRRQLPQPLDERPGDIGHERGFLFTGGVPRQTDVDKGH